MKLNIKVQVVLRDKNGKITKIINKVCHSYILAMVDLLAVHMGEATLTIKDTGGTSQSVAAFYLDFSCKSASADNTYGIQVGTGSDAILITDYKLKTLIANGTGANLLNYGSTSIGACATVGTTRQFTIARTLTNNSGGDITVNEVGLAVKTQLYKLLVEHSLLTFTITNGTSGTVTYTISATV